jgi:tellurite resistance protein
MQIPPNFFGIAFGLTSLSEAWNTARAIVGVPVVVPRVLAVFAAAVWLVLVSCYLAQGRARIVADLKDPVLAPFTAGAVIAPMFLGAELAAVAPTAGRVVVVTFLALTVALGGWLTGRWMLGGIPPAAYHPGYLVPTVAGGLVGGDAAAAVHLHAVAAASFGTGVISWLVLGSTVFGRLFFQAPLPAALRPTLAIEVLPPAAAGTAWFAVDRGAVDLVAYAIGGYAILMMLVQLRLIPVYRGLRYTPAFWVFTFCYASAATDALAWLEHTRPAGTADWGIAVLTLISGLVAAIGARTIVAIVKGQFLPGAERAGEPGLVTTGDAQ